MCNTGICMIAGHSEGEYFGTPQASPGERTTRSSGHDELPHGQTHTSSEARRELNLSAPLQGAPPHERHVQEPYTSSQQSSDNRDMANTGGFQTARSHASDDHHTGSTGVVGSILGAVGLGGRDSVEEHGDTHTTSQNDNTSSSNTGVLGSIKAAVGLGDNATGSTQYASGDTRSSGGPAWSPNPQQTSNYNSSADTGINTGAAPPAWSHIQGISISVKLILLST